MLGWTPETFWQATPVELAAALRGRLGPPPPAAPGRADLEHMKREWVR